MLSEVVMVQLDIAWEDKRANYDRVRSLLSGKRPAPGSLVVLPEMFNTGFTMNTELAEDLNGPTFDFLRAAAREFDVYIYAGIAERGEPGIFYNSALVVSPTGEVIAHYRKLQPFVFGELAKYKAGDDVCIFDWSGGKCAAFVCFDLRFPEHFRTAVSAGAELMINVASWPNTGRIHHWNALLQARAIENQCFMLGVNRTGVDPNLPYNGQSALYGPDGIELIHAGHLETIVSHGIDFDWVRRYRSELPFLAQMRR